MSAAPGAITIPSLLADPTETPESGKVFLYTVGSSHRMKTSNGTVYTFSTTNADTDEWEELVLTAEASSSSSITLLGLTALGFNAVVGRKYFLEYTLIFKTAATGTGLAITIGTSSNAVGSLAAQVAMPRANDGTGSFYQGSITSLGDLVISDGVQNAAPDQYICSIKGVFVCTTGGFVLPHFRSEVNNSTVTIGEGSSALIRGFI